MPELEQSSGHKVKMLQTDQGGEYMNKEFEEFLKGHGIRHEFATADSPQQNGVSERMN